MLTRAGVSFSFIGCPSNLNRICLIESPCWHKHILMNKATWTDKGLLSSQKKGLKVLRCTFQGYSTTNSKIKFEKKNKKLQSCTLWQKVTWQRTTLDDCWLKCFISDSGADKEALWGKMRAAPSLDYEVTAASSDHFSVKVLVSKQP